MRAKWFVLGYGCGFLTGFIVDWNKPSPRGMQIERRACIEQCIIVEREKAVFPEFSELIKQCELKFPNGCHLIGE